jgi:hypothetical protein
MQATRASLFRYLSSSIHPPLLDQRSATLLLLALSTSFQTHLDRQITSKDLSKRHFERLLFHPIFNPPPPTTNDQSSRLDTFTEFQRAIAQGNLTPWVVKTCLASISKSSDGYEPDAIGIKFINLLRSTDEPLFQRILNHGSCRVYLIRLLILEKQHDVVRKLIQERRSRSLLNSYLQVCILEEGIEYAIRVANQLIIELMPTRPGGKKAVHHGFIAIPMHLLMNPHDIAGVSTEAYDLLLKNALALAGNPGRSKYGEVLYATLALCKPKSPNPTPALNFFNSVAEDVDLTKLWNDRVIRRLSLHLILRLSDILIKQERFEEATWSLSFAQSTFPTELGLDKERSFKPVSRSKSVTNEAILGRLEGLLST